LAFKVKEEATTYAECHPLEYTAQLPPEVKPKFKAYADNFLVRAARCRFEIKPL
tara:strand:- start:163 stop:324 length:162 start_codon:yes stop_codon:yes gene_type:complete